jgi:hypothetical protein
VSSDTIKHPSPRPDRGRPHRARSSSPTLLTSSLGPGSGVAVTPALLDASGVVARDTPRRVKCAWHRYHRTTRTLASNRKKLKLPSPIQQSLHGTSLPRFLSPLLMIKEGGAGGTRFDPARQCSLLILLSRLREESYSLLTECSHDIWITIKRNVIM